MNTTAEILAEGRHKKGLTVRNVAGALTLSPQTISFSENKALKRRMVSDEVIKKIAEYYTLDGEKLLSQYQTEQKELKAKNKEYRKASKILQEAK